MSHEEKISTKKHRIELNKTVPALLKNHQTSDYETRL